MVKQTSKSKILSQNEAKRMKSWENANESYKSIFTDCGINMGGLCELIKNCLDLCEDDEKATWADNIAFQAILFGSYNYYEALGIIESVKERYSTAWHENLNKSNNG